MAIEFLQSAPVVPAPEAEQCGPPADAQNQADAGRQTDAGIEALISVAESIEHRASASGLSDILETTQRLSAILARLRDGTGAADLNWIAGLRESSEALTRQLDARLEGQATDPVAMGRVHRYLIALELRDAAASAIPTHETQAQTKPTSLYFPVRLKFTIATLGGLLWMSVSIYLARHWFGELSQALGPIVAPVAIAGIAIIPGFMNAFLLISLALDRRPKHARLDQYPAITILIAAYNEAANIADTIQSIDRQAYPGSIEVIVINDGSKDRTAALVTEQMAQHPWLKLIDLQHNGGKAIALNHGLVIAKSSLVLTVDADSYLYHDALQNIVERYFEDPPNTRAVSGTVLVRNSRKNWITKVQEWDYFHGIAAIKRVQSLFQGTLVAQGAFSLYDRQTLIEAGGWPDCIGEDIVLTWAILKTGHRIGHSEQACLFTNAPDTLLQFVRQRQRWSRGMVEAFKQHPGILLKPRLSTFFIYWNLLFPALDFLFTVFFIPGLILGLFGHYYVVGPMTLALLPLALLMNFFMFSIGKKTFTEKHLQVRHNLLGFLIYTVVYSLIMQPACLIGYVSEMLNLKKTWGTK